MASPTPLEPWSSQLWELLHFDHVLSAIAENCVTAAGRELLLASAPLGDPDERSEALRATAELVQLLEAHSPPPFRAVDDIRADLSGRDKGGPPLSAEQFGSLRTLLLAATALQKFFAPRPELAHWSQAARSLQPWPDGMEAIDRIVDDDLTVKSSASPTLGKIRAAISRKEVQVRSRLAALHARALDSGWGQPEPVAWRDGRLVIALKASHKRKIKGLIHGYSGSGATAFVEPLEVFELNNEIAALAEDEQAEIIRVLTQLTAELGPYMAAVLEALAVIHSLDRHLAIARWSHANAAVEPRFSDDGSLTLRQARNPVLASHREVVPLDLSLSPRERLLLISGPNAGGKTVVLLTTGLLALMAHCGLPVPAREAIFPALDGLYADLGDRQSLTQDLSTFSAHLTNLKAIAAVVGPGSLVLLDELGTGTEPESGAALGQAFLEEIRARGALCLATTHLNRLKMWAQGEDGVVSGAMTFDNAELAPTFQLQLHQPGASYALEIAQRLGLDPKLLERARELIPDSAMEVEQLLVTLQNQRTQVAAETAALEARAADFEAREQSLRQREDQVAAAHRRAEKDALAEARELVSAINRRLEGVIAGIRSRDDQLTSDDIRRAKGEMAAIRAELDGRAEQLKGAAPAPLTADQLLPGQWVELRSQGRRGEIVRTSQGGRKVAVDIDGTRITVPVEDLLPAEPPQEPANEGHHAVTVELAGSAGFQLDLRGQRGDEAVAELDKFLNRAILADLHELEIIHGKGTGALQNRVHEALDEHPQVASFRFANFDAGGTGATLVTLK